MKANSRRRRAAVPLLAFLTLTAAGCATPDREAGQVAPRNPAPSTRSDTMTFEHVKSVMDRHAPALMAHDGVVGVSIGALEDSSFVIQILIRERNAALLDSLPDMLEGIPVRVEETGEIRPLGD